MVQLGFYFHMQQALGSTRIALTWPLLCAICFMLVFSVVIALFKDIPDVKGDSQVSLTLLCVSIQGCMCCPTKEFCHLQLSCSAVSIVSNNHICDAHALHPVSPAQYTGACPTLQSKKWLHVLHHGRPCHA